MTAQHTPGPWVTHPSTRYRGDINMAWDVATHAATWDANDYDDDEQTMGAWQFPDDYRRIASTSDMGPEAAANARLIAAAPTLLEAAQAAENWIDTYHTSMGYAADDGVAGLLAQLRAAIDAGGGGM